jgi:hypothetical protein
MTIYFLNVWKFDQECVIKVEIWFCLNKRKKSRMEEMENIIDGERWNREEGNEIRESERNVRGRVYVGFVFFFFDKGIRGFFTWVLFFF